MPLEAIIVAGRQTERNETVLLHFALQNCIDDGPQSDGEHRSWAR
jgi:hypothetical protein